MKNIKITTFHRAHNYGAILQAYALQNFFLSYNYNVKIIDYRCKKIEEPYNIKFSKNMNFKGIIKLLIKRILFEKKIRTRWNNFNKFIENNLILTESCKNICNVVNTIDIEDVLITGSDQVWNADLVGCIDDVYSLNLGVENLKISYAASVGNLELIDQYKDEFIKKIGNIDYISIREESAKNVLEKLTNKKIQVVLDPTLLIDRSFWNNIIKKNSSNEKYIFCYMVEKDLDFINIVNYISSVTGLKIIYANLKNPGFNGTCSSIYESDPIDFLNYLFNSEFVLTTSFHATAFSIIFHKKFLVVPHKKTGNRVIDLLDKLNLNNRIINKSCDVSKIDVFDNIDWVNADLLLDNERKKSVDWILNAINLGDRNE